MTAPAATIKTPLQRAKDAQQARATDTALKLTRQMMQDDHWANGEGWTGPIPALDESKESGANVARISAEIRRGFVSRNLPENVVSRHVYGITGREPLLGITPRRAVPDGQEPAEQDKARIKEYWDAWTDWWDNSGAWLPVQQAIRTAVWSGKGTLRLFIPRSKLVALPGQVDDQGRPLRGIPKNISLSEALSYVSVQAPEWDQAGIVRDGEGRVTSAYYRYKDEQGQERWELQERIDGQTLVTPAATGNAADPSDLYPVSDLLLFEVSLDPLVKESIRRLARFGNKTLTMGSRNIDLGGFIERTILNAQMPGEWVPDEKAHGGRRFVPSTYNVGAGVTNFLSGTAIMTPDPKDPKRLVPSGNFASPSIVYKDPVGWDTFGDTFAAVREAIFEEARQLHVLISGDATASGVSRVQAVQDFLTSLEPTRMALEQLLRWLMTTVLSLGLHFTGRRAEWDAYKATAQARVSVVQPTPEQIKTANEMRDARRISYKTWCSMVGIEEPEAEQAALAAEPITQDVALVLLERAPTWVGLRALSIAFPALGITEQDVAAQRELELAQPVEPTPLGDDDPDGANQDDADGTTS